MKGLICSLTKLGTAGKTLQKFASGHEEMEKER